jgi:signal transduction histidine kinase
MTRAVDMGEAKRSRALQHFQNLDASTEETLDRIVRLAGRAFGVPTALISFVDQKQQWIKAGVGVAAREMPWYTTFCARTLQAPDVLVILDAAKDHRSRLDDVLVTSGSKVRFYAGAPLSIADGQRIGTLSIVDTVPRQAFSEEDCEALQTLAELAANRINACGDLGLPLATGASTGKVRAGAQPAPLEAHKTITADRTILRQLTHDLRTPLNAIIGFSELLEMGLAGPLSQQQSAYVADVHTAGLRLLTIVADTLSRVEAAMDKRSPSPLDNGRDRNVRVYPRATNAILSPAGR